MADDPDWQAFASARQLALVACRFTEPGVGHIVGRSRDVALVLYEDALELRITPGSTVLNALDDKTGFIGDIDEKTYKPMAEERAPNYPTAWMPTERVAKAWRAIVSGEPFEK